MSIFNNRELATIIWGIIGFSAAICSASIRKAIFGVIKAAFVKQIVITYILAIIYTVLGVYILYRIGFWDKTLLKDTAIWILFVSVIIIFKNSKIHENKNYLSEAVKDNLSYTAIIAFIIGLSSFSLFIELLLVPVSVIIGVLLAAATVDTKVRKLLNSLVMLIGAIVFLYSIEQILINLKDVAQISALKDFFLPIVLSVLFVPFIYFLFFYMSYESCFCFISLSNVIKSSTLIKYAKLKAIINFNINIKSLNRWRMNLFATEIHTKDDILKSIKEIKQQLRIEKNPPKIEKKMGWSPYAAKDFLLQNDIKTGYYKNSYDNEWMACSSRIKLDNRILSNNINYYVQGDQSVAKSLKLVINVNLPAEARIAHTELLICAKKLFSNALNKIMPLSLEKAILNGKQLSIEEELIFITIRRENYLNNKGYDITFAIHHK